RRQVTRPTALRRQVTRPTAVRRQVTRRTAGRRQAATTAGRGSDQVLDRLARAVRLDRRNTVLASPRRGIHLARADHLVVAGPEIEIRLAVAGRLLDVAFLVAAVG